MSKMLITMEVVDGWPADMVEMNLKEALTRGPMYFTKSEIDSITVRENHEEDQDE